jgi:hypothetical protein
MTAIEARAAQPDSRISNVAASNAQNGINVE